jgi:hypothetical protein
VSILAEEERSALIRVIENLFANEKELHTMIMDANLHHRFLAETKFTDPHRTTKKLIKDLERYGPIPEQPTYHALGALLSSLLELEVRPLLPSEARFFAWLIARYSLVYDASYIDKLRARYSLPEILAAAPIPIARLPSYSQSRSYAVLDIQLFAHQEPEYQVQLRFSRPGDTTMRAPISGNATFNIQGLLTATIDPHEYGKCLTRSLFQDQAIKQAFHDIYTATGANNLPLRLRLFIDNKANKLHALRWETLLHPLKMDSPLLTSEHILFSRFLGTYDFRQGPSSFNTPHKALLVIANPTDITEYGINRQPFAAIPVQDELDRAAKYLSIIPHRDLVSNPSSPGRVTLTNLIARLREGYTILYLICHGAMFTKKQELSPCLYLERANGTADIVPVKELITRIEHMSQRPQLVVLGSCQSVGDGTYGPDGANMLTTLGPELVFAGVPSVVGMQGKILMDTLAKFMPTFFTEWQSDGQLDRAIAVARSTVIQQDDWWMPVLFTRLIDGHL